VSSSASSNQKLVLALISDTGGPAASGTTFYYNVGSRGNGFQPTNSLGPGPLAVSQLVQSWQPSDLFAIGDLAYNAGGSTLQDISIGQYYNNFIYPYPSPAYRKQPYTTIDGEPVDDGRKSWPYNIYDYPDGFPNPVTGGRGGSLADERNHFWGSLGNHDYGMAIGYSQVGVTPYNFDGERIGRPVGPSSTTSLASFVDYVVPFLEDPELLGDDKARLNVGAVDKSGNRGAYYSMSFGGTVEQPLVEFFMLDTERLNINAGFEEWNPSGAKTSVSDSDRYFSEVEDNKPYSFTYNPSDPSSLASVGTTTDPNNGYDQFTWLRQSLENSTAPWKIITGHHPVYASGRWSDRQPDDHMSVPYMQRLLNALPEGSFDAYYNGHDHFYERVIESKAGGIGLGIPFITNGNSGRNLSKKIQVSYGESVYDPESWDLTEGTQNPNLDAVPYLLDSAPLEVASSGLAGGGANESRGFSNGLYGYGFGATRLEVEEGYLLFKYEEAPLIDPAIANHLAGGIEPDFGSGTDGIASTLSTDWIPDPNGSFNGEPDLAQFKLQIEDGVVVGVELDPVVNGGRGYMSSKGGNYVVRGFNLYGNNIDALKPWEGTAQVDLTFVGGSLTKVELKDGGRGYELAVQAAADNNTATSTKKDPLTRDLMVALNYNLNEIQYLVRDDTPLYNDWYLIAETAVDPLALELGAFGGLEISLSPSSSEAKDYLAANPAITSGYSGTGAQRAYTVPQQGSIRVTDSNGTLVAGDVSAPLTDGRGSLQFSRRPAPGALNVEFGGDALSSYLVNFRSATRSVNLSYGTWSSGIALTSANTIDFDQDVNLSLIRTDSVAGPVSFGFKRQGVSTPSILVSAANGASASSLNANSIFVPNGGSSWLSTESQSLGSYVAALGSMAAGEWIPVALNQAGQELAIQNLQISGNAIEATFLGGFSALYNTAGSGVSPVVPGSGNLIVTIQRLGAQNNGLAFYEADPITGAVTVNGQLFLPTDGASYLQAALASAQEDGLILGSNRLPAYGSELVIADLPLDSQQNYGLLLLRNNSSSDLVSSYSAANAGGAVGMVSFVAPDRGLYYGIEDLPLSRADNDFNDLIVGLSTADFQIAGPV
jgi:hypothetical protein